MKSNIKIYATNQIIKEGVIFEKNTGVLYFYNFIIFWNVNKI